MFKIYLSFIKLAPTKPINTLVIYRRGRRFKSCRIEYMAKVLEAFKIKGSSTFFCLKIVLGYRKKIWEGQQNSNKSFRDVGEWKEKDVFPCWGDSLKMGSALIIFSFACKDMGNKGI